MTHVTFQLHGDLADLLSPDQQNHSLVYDLAQESSEKVTVKHVAESLGIPHTEIDQISANGETVTFTYILTPGDTIDLWAFSPKPDLVNLRSPLPRPVRFVLDTHLGRLAVYLRLLGFDALYRNDYTDPQLAELSAQEGRLLLTRDRGLLKRSIVDFGYCVRESSPKQQLISLIRRYQLAAEIDPWRRCLRCNGLLEPVDKAEILDQLEPKTILYFNDFRRCPQCGQIYWRGSHYDHMQSFIEEVRQEAERS
jgi:uncharacterized protein with PIN domain